MRGLKLPLKIRLPTSVYLRVWQLANCVTEHGGVGRTIQVKEERSPFVSRSDKGMK